ncbi:MAG: NAD(P)-binding protein [Thiobacillus sp.]|nr:NAD(P)-binding protein [Thiobacillus sp.]
MAQLRAGIVGAGIAGASCAGTLAAAGWDVEVFEQAPTTGGRIFTQQLNPGWAAMGSPFISAKREPFRSQLRDWVRQGWLVPLRGNVWLGRAADAWAHTQLKNHFTLQIEPAQLMQHLLGTARLHTQTRVATLQPRTIILENGQTMGNYDCVICSVPAPQAIPMLEALPRLRERLVDVRYRPVWSFLMRWEGGPAVDVIQFDDHLLKLAVRQHAGGEGLWMVHSSNEFAETYLEASAMEACTRGASALMGLLGLPWPVEVEASHLWRHAQPEGSIGGFWLGDRENRVALIGDGIAGTGIERAWESGVRLAQSLVQAKAELANCPVDLEPNQFVS